MSKIAREIATGLEETLIAGNHSKHASHVLGVIPKSELEEFIDEKLAPTLALMDRLATAATDVNSECFLFQDNARQVRYQQDFDPVIDMIDKMLDVLVDYEAYLKEQG